MPNGDDAAAAGMAVMDGTEDRRDGWDEINLTRDYIAQRTSTVTPISKGGTGANTAAGARTNLGVQDAVDDVNNASTDPPTAGGKLARYNSVGKLATEDPTAALHCANKQYVDNAVPTSLDGMSGGTVSGGITATGNIVSNARLRSPGSRGFTVVTSYASAYLDGDGWLGITPSAARFKQDVTAHPYSLAQLRLIQVVAYRLITAVESDPDAPYEVGVIAEQLIDAGMPEFVVFNDAGQTQSVAYERLVLVAIGAAQELADRLDDLEARLAALEGNG